MLNTVENFLNKYNIKNATIALGFSSGPDSCALALILNELKEKYNLKLILCYFNHNWRDEALEEEIFTENFAKKLNINFLIGKAPKDAKKSEEIARELRYDFFNEISKKYNSEYIFLAHNKNDNIETLIYRIIKGTSIKGLCSIPEKREIFYRPFLSITKDEILNFLKQNNQNFMIDSSNEDTKYKRNLIRKKILPLFKEISPNYLNNIENLIKNSINSREIIEEKIEEIKKEIFNNNKIYYEKYVNLDVKYRLEILNDFIGNYLKYRNRKNLIMYDDFILNNKHSKTSLNSDYFLRTRYKMIFIEENNKCKKI